MSDPEKDLADYVVGADTTLLDAVECIERNGSRAAVVVDVDTVVGVLSEGDVMRALLGGVDIHAPLGPYLRVAFKYLVTVDWDRALDLTRTFGISLIPVVTKDFKLRDVITVGEVLQRVVLARTGAET